MPSIKDVSTSACPGSTLHISAEDSNTVDARLAFDHRAMPTQLVIEPSASDFWRMKFLTDVFKLLIEIDGKTNSRRQSPDSRLDAEVFAVLNKDERVAHLHLLGVTVIEPIHDSIPSALQAVCMRLGELAEEMQFEILDADGTLDSEGKISFTSPRGFSFWRHEMSPSGKGWDLHVIPAYHPCMQDGRKSVFMINGDTAHAMQKVGIGRVSSPRTARAEHASTHSSDSWKQLVDPFKAKGAKFEIVIDLDLIRTKEGVENLHYLLCGALEKDGAWIAVSGGFRAPLPIGHNRIIELGIASPYARATPGTLARGSEEHCVWAYRHLETEGKLKDAHVPEWFMKEGWLDIYKGVAEKPGSL